MQKSNHNKIQKSKTKNYWTVEITHCHNGKFDKRKTKIDENFIFDYRLVKYAFERMYINLLTNEEMQNRCDLDEYTQFQLNSGPISPNNNE